MESGMSDVKIRISYEGEASVRIEVGVLGEHKHT